MDTEQADSGAALRAHIQGYLAHLAAHPPDNGLLSSYAIVDDAAGHYLVLDVGWSGGRRVHATVLHVRLVAGRVIVEHDGTPGGVEGWLVARGVPEDVIVGGAALTMPAHDPPVHRGDA